MNNKEDKNKMNTSSALNMNTFDDMFSDMFQQEEAAEMSNEQQPVSEEEQKDLVNNGNVEVISKNVNNASNIDNIVDKLNIIEQEMANEFVEREELIKTMLLSLVSSSNLLMLGPPGTAKSKITKALCNKIDDTNYFEYMLNKTSDPSELLGPFSVKQMEHDKFIRTTTGKLPEANVAFIDEVYKSNAPTLNALLTIMNEHIFYNDGRPVDVPLLSMFAASNEPPEDDTLLALHDRFLFRINVEYIHNHSNRELMFNNYIHERAGINNSIVSTTVTVDEIKTLQKRAMNIPVPKKIITEFGKLLNNIDRNYGIVISDRRSNECLKVLQSSALLAKRKKVGVEDFAALKYVLCEKPEDVDKIASEIDKLENPYEKKIENLKADFAIIKETIMSAPNSTEKNKLFFQYQDPLKKCIKKANQICSEIAQINSDATNIIELRDEIAAFNNDLANEALGDTVSQFGIDLNGSLNNQDDSDNSDNEDLF